MAHLERVEGMAGCYNIGPLAGSSSLLVATKKALDFWFGKDFQNPNWYVTRVHLNARARMHTRSLTD